MARQRRGSPETDPAGDRPRRQKRELVAEAFGAEPELLPLFPALFADFEALGGWPDRVVRALEEATDLSEGALVADLGCGKGAVAIAIARRFGCRVRGVDLFEPFLQAAAEAARAAGVDRLCSFAEGDLRDVIRETESFDAVVFSAVGAGLFGDYAGCVGALRRCLRPGGHLVLCDGFLSRPMAPDARPRGYEYYEVHEETVRQLAAHGDRLVREIVVSREELGRQSRRDLASLRRQTRRLSESRPEHRRALEQFLAAQEAEYGFLDACTEESVWLLRRE